MIEKQIPQPVRIPKAAEIVASHIRKQIVRGELKPGDKLPAEPVLLGRFDVSRPTLREALRILEWEGLITVTRGAKGGASVNAGLSDLVARATGIGLQSRRASIADLFEARTMIEPHAARLAAERRPHEAAQVLRALVVTERASVHDAAAMARAVAGFHQAVLDESGNITLSVVGAALRSIVERHLELTYRQRNPSAASAKSIQRGFASHAKLVDLIAAGRGEDAEKHWQEHMVVTSKVLLDRAGMMAVVDIMD
ncbi:GntR family transcriptional regulator [Sphingobium sp. Sx8-8]|uniref:FadR/GntR family transcriptional regulator n=1 Tax=Sphingobium sp. Sx8-8 TaxID=2933617 RepID=UPI0032AFD6C6